MRPKGTICIITLAVTMVMATLTSGCTVPSASAPPTPAGRETPIPKPTAPSQKLEQVKFQTPTYSAVFLPYYLGRDKGFYSAENISIQPIALKAPLMLSALLSGEVDYTTQSSTIVQSALKGVEVKLLMQIDKTAVWHLMVRPEIKTAADLKGKVIALSSIGKSAHYAARQALSSLGLDADKEVTFIGIPDEMAMLQAVKAGSAAAAQSVSPYDLVGKEMGFKELMYVGDLFPLATNGVATTDRKIRENPSQVKRLLQATLKTILYIRDRPSETIEYLVKEFQLEKKLAEASYNDLVRNYSYGIMSQENLDALVGEGLFTGTLKKENLQVPLDKVLNLAFVKEAQKELGLEVQKDLRLKP